MGFDFDLKVINLVIVMVTFTDFLFLLPPPIENSDNSQIIFTFASTIDMFPETKDFSNLKMYSPKS